MVTMRDAANPFALKWTLARTNTDDQDVVVLSVRMMGAGGPEFLSADQQSFSEHEQMLFTKAVSVAESFGKNVSLLVVPAGDIFAALAQSANSLEVDSVVSGVSTKMTAEEQAFHLGQAWEALPEPKRQFNFYVVDPSGQAKVFYIGPHAPALSPDDVQLVHRLWLNMRRDPIHARPAPQRHHHLRADPACRPICSRKTGDSCAICATTRPRTLPRFRFACQDPTSQLHRVPILRTPRDRRGSCVEPRRSRRHSPSSPILCKSVQRAACDPFTRFLCSPSNL